MLYYFHKNLKRKLRIGIKYSGGRNFLGRICIRGRGCANKILAYKIDIHRRLCSYGKLVHIIYDSRRTATVGCILYTNGLFAYILLTQNKFYIGALYYSGYNIANKNNIIEEGWAMPLENFSLFSQICILKQKKVKDFQYPVPPVLSVYYITGYKKCVYKNAFWLTSSH